MLQLARSSHSKGLGRLSAILMRTAFLCPQEHAPPAAPHALHAAMRTAGYAETTNRLARRPRGLHARPAPKCARQACQCTAPASRPRDNHVAALVGRSELEDQPQSPSSGMLPVENCMRLFCLPASLPVVTTYHIVRLWHAWRPSRFRSKDNPSRREPNWRGK